MDAWTEDQKGRENRDLYRRGRGRGYTTWPIRLGIEKWANREKDWKWTNQEKDWNWTNQLGQKGGSRERTNGVQVINITPAKPDGENTFCHREGGAVSLCFSLRGTTTILRSRSGFFSRQECLYY